MKFSGICNRIPNLHVQFSNHMEEKEDNSNQRIAILQIPSSQLRLSLQNLPQESQSLGRKSNHVALPITSQTCTHFFLKHSLLARNSQRNISPNYPLLTSRTSSDMKCTYGVLLGVLPPVGPAVPDSQMQYVAPSLERTFEARPATMSGVGPW